MMGTVDPMNIEDIYIPRSAQALPHLPGEHVEALVLDFTTGDGRIIMVVGRASVWEQTSVVFVDVPPAYTNEVDPYTASSVLQDAVRDRRIGSGVVQAAVERGFAVRGLARVETAS